MWPPARISEKTGMRLDATLERGDVSGRLPAEIWEISKESEILSCDTSRWVPFGVTLPS